MNDDIFKKLKTILSGSVQLNKDTGLEAQPQKVDEELVGSLMDQILDSAWIEEDLKSMCAPCYYLSKNSKSYWLMNTTLKTLVNIKGGVEVIPIDAGSVNTICLVGQSTYSIPNKYIVCSGWN